MFLQTTTDGGDEVFKSVGKLSPLGERGNIGR